MLKDVVIVGAGPAGLTAALYLKRAGFNPLIFESKEIGGLLLNANLVENYPGFPQGIRGTELVRLFKSQLKKWSITVKKRAVKKIYPEKGRFRLAASEDEIFARSVIVATGTFPKKIKLKGLNQLLGRKVFYEIKELPSLKKMRKVVIIGGGDAAFDYALNLSKQKCKVNIIFRSEKPKCLHLLEQRAKLTSNIGIFPKTLPVSLVEKDNKLVVDCKSNGKSVEFNTDYLLIACGREANLEILPSELRKALKIKENGETNIPGLYLAGDVRRGNLRQTGIAVGDGLLAAMSLSSFLKRSEAL